MAVPMFLDSLEQSGLSRWLRESTSIFGFYFILTLHTVGLSLVVGPNAAIDLRLLGVARTIPLAPLRDLFQLMWLGLALNVITGVLLVLSYPTKAFTNPDFYLKLSLIGLAVLTLYLIKTEVFSSSDVSDANIPPAGKRLAVRSLILWVGVIGAGRLLAYTCNYLLYGVPC